MRYNARLVTNDYTQINEIDDIEIFLPIAKYTFIKILLISSILISNWIS